jgi:anoctamin-10
VLKVVVGSLNGIVMTVLSTVYKMIVSRVVQWENHRHDSEFQFSYIMKLFLFEFLNSYIVLIYQAVYTRDPAELGINVGSITITRGYPIKTYSIDLSRT